MRVLLALLLAAALPAVALAAEWDTLARLHPGDRISVRYSEGAHVRTAKGRFAAWTDASLAIETDRGKTTLARADVQLVKRQTGRNRARGAGLGALVGGAAGAGIFGGLVATHAEGDSIVPPGAIVAAGAVAFAVIGTLIGLAVGTARTEVIYRQ